MKLTLNGQEQEFAGARTLADLLRRMEIDPQGPGIAVAWNGRVIPRSDLESTRLSEGDRIEVVRAVQGG